MCTEAVKANTAFADAVRISSGVDVCTSFAEYINAYFDLELFHKVGDGGFSHADAYTFLPLILADKTATCKPELTALKGLYEVFAEFRDVFGLMYNPPYRLPAHLSGHLKPAGPSAECCQAVASDG